MERRGRDETPRLRLASTSETVPADWIDNASPADLDEAQRLWPPVLRSVVQASAAQGGASGIKVWQGNWTVKTALLGEPAFSIQGLRVGGRVQGLIKLVVERQASILSASGGGGRVYVDLLEVAPWNVARYMNALGQNPVYKDVGQELVRLAVGESLRRGLEGRIGLHSVPRAEGFYDVIGMTRLGSDPDKEGLVGFEFEGTAAEAFYRRRGR